MQLKLFLHSLRETEKFGRLIGKIARTGDVILLFGDLGAGKTTLTQFVARGLEVPSDNYITSPSFSLMNQYFGRLPLYHIDCYRLENEDDVEASGLLDYIVADGLTVIEWPDRLGSLSPDDRLEIEFISERDEERLVKIKGYGPGWQERLPIIAMEFSGQDPETAVQSAD